VIGRRRFEEIFVISRPKKEYHRFVDSSDHQSKSNKRNVARKIELSYDQKKGGHKTITFDNVARKREGWASRGKKSASSAEGREFRSFPTEGRSEKAFPVNCRKKKALHIQIGH